MRLHGGKFFFAAGLVVLTGLILSACQAATLPSSPEEVPRVTIAELRQMMEKDASILIVDTRSEAVFQNGHIAGAVSAPSATILAGKWAPPQDRELILY